MKWHVLPSSHSVLTQFHLPFMCSVWLLFLLFFHRRKPFVTWKFDEICSVFADIPHSPTLSSSSISQPIELFWLPDVARLGRARQTDFDDHWPSNAFRLAIILQGSHSTNPKDMFWFYYFCCLVGFKSTCVIFVTPCGNRTLVARLLPQLQKPGSSPQVSCGKPTSLGVPLGSPGVPWVGCWLWAPWTSSSVMETPRRRGTTSVVSPWATHLGCWQISGCEIWEDSPWIPWYFHKHKILHRLVS